MNRFDSQFQCFLLIAFIIFSATNYGQAQTVPVGSGSYSTVLPPKAIGPQNFQGTPVSPKVSPSFTLPVQTNDYWSSLIFPFYGIQFSNTIYVHPSVVKATADGLGIGYTKDPVFAAADYLYPYQQQLTVGVEGLNAPKTLVDDYGDWTVTASWNDGVRSMKATIGHGLPYTYFTLTGGNAKIVCTGAPTIWSNQNGVVGLTVGGRHYGIFGPSGSVWTGTTTLLSTLNGKDFLSVAILPDNTPATLEYYRKHAYAFVTGSTVSWNYDQLKAKLVSTFSLTTILKDTGNGNVNNTLTALYRHQWLNTNAVITSYSYVSVHGAMKIFDGNQFTTSMDFNGILPSLPDEGIYNPSILNSYINTVAAESLSAGPIYENGKSIARFASVVRIADQLGNTNARDHFLSQMKKRLEAWLTAGGTEELSYIAQWNTLSAYPSGYGADNQLNDHNFHYGYLIMAAATIAQYDSAWASQSKWGGMINLMIKDCANWERADTKFPFLRSFDPYAGHSWEAGHGDFGDGNNEESSSESMNFSSAVMLWGAATQNKEIRDLGIFLYANERAAIEQYWFDVDHQVFPSTYSYKALGMVWGGKGVHSTWFGADPEFIHGINILPLTGGSLYLGRRPEYVTLNYNEIVKEIGSLPRKWKDIIWEYLAFSDPQTALNQYYADPNYEQFDGETKAHTYHWLGNLKKMGRVNTTISADVPTYAVFTTDDLVKTYVAYNPGSDSVRVHFSDGFSMSVPAHQQISFNTDTTNTNSPIAVTLANVSSGKAPLKVNFVGSNSFDKSGSIVSYHWEFGDSTSANSADTTHLFQSPGTYKAILTVKNNINVVGRGEITITVLGNGTSYKGTPVLIPGVVQAEEYDLGGESVAYHDSDPKNVGVPFRSTEGVDIEGCADTGGGYDVGWTAAGEWMEYSVEVSDSGVYDITARTASVPGIGSFHIEFNGINVTGKKSVPSTGGWQFWKDVTASNIALAKGKQIMRFAIESNEFTLNYINIKKIGASVAGQKENILPENYFLGQNYPNPFNPSTTIQYGLPTTSKVSIKIYNILGQLIVELVNGELQAGWHEAVWSARAASGLYFYRIDATSNIDPKQHFTQLKKMILLK